MRKIRPLTKHEIAKAPDDTTHYTIIHNCVYFTNGKTICCINGAGELSTPSPLIHMDMKFYRPFVRNFKQRNTQKVYAWRLDNGLYYRKPANTHGLWHIKGYSRKDLTTKSMLHATHFNKDFVDEIGNKPPYNESFLMKGKWVKLEITHIAKLEE